MRIRSLLPLLPGLFLILVCGCSAKKSNRGVDLSGAVSYNGKPVTGGSMTLYVGDGIYPVAISADGTYSATQIPEGEAIVTVDTEALNPNKPKYGDGRPQGGMSPVPEGASQGPTGKYVKLPAKY